MKTSWIAVLLVLAGCVSVPQATGPLFSEAPPQIPGKALVIVYRADTFKASAVETHIYANGRAMATITNASYSWAYAQPGQYTITSVLPTCDVIPLVKSVDAGSTYFIRADVEFNITQENRCLSTDVSAADAILQLRAAHSLGRGYDMQQN